MSCWVIVAESPAGRQQGGLVHRVGEVGPREPRRGLGDPAEIDVGGQRLVADVDLEDRLAPFEVGRVDDDLTVESTGAEQGAVEHLGPVGRGQAG